MTASPYETLCELAEQELELLAEGHIDDVALLDQRRAALIATLPATPPADARSALERCALLERRVEIELRRGREALLVALAEVDHGRRAASGYAPPLSAPARFQASA